MGKIKWFGIVLIVCCLVSWASAVSAQKLDATVLYRQNSDTGYTALVPGYSDPASPDCAADLANAQCYNPAHSTQTSYNVVGTTLSLLLPDGKIAVVNCVNQYKYSSGGAFLPRRSCGMPLVEHVQAQFKGNIAKLEWPIGPDDRKIESEKYKVVAVLEKR